MAVLCILLTSSAATHANILEVIEAILNKYKMQQMANHLLISLS